MHTHPANPVVYIPPCAAVGGDWNTLLSVEVQSVAAPVVMSTSLVCFFSVNVPIALNETIPPVATGLGTPLLSMVVLVADARGVNVGVTVLCLGVGVTVAVGEGGAPVEITIAMIAKPGGAVVVEVLLLPPLQLSRIAPKTNNR